MVAALLKTIFAQDTAASAREQWRKVADTLRPRFQKVSEIMDKSEEGGLAYTAFPKAHWPQISSANPIERVNKEIKRRSDVVGIFPNEQMIECLVGAILP